MTTIVASALGQRGIDVTTTLGAGLVSASDEEQFAYALREQRVLITRDHDFLALARRGVAHAGIVYWHPGHRDLREAIHLLTLLWRMDSAESMIGRIEFL